MVALENLYGCINFFGTTFTACWLPEDNRSIVVLGRFKVDVQQEGSSVKLKLAFLNS